MIQKMEQLKKLKGLWFFIIIYLIVFGLKRFDFFTQELFTQWYRFFLSDLYQSLWLGSFLGRRFYVPICGVVFNSVYLFSN